MIFRKKSTPSLVTARKPGALRFLRPSPSGAAPPRKGRPGRKLLSLALLACLGAAGFHAFSEDAAPDAARGTERRTRVVLPVPQAFPAQDTLQLRGNRWITHYTPDAALQARTVRYLNRYRPEGAVVAVCDLKTGQIRVLAERDESGTRTRPELALGTTYPAASLAKIITAAAVLENGIHAPLDDLPLLGGAYTLYRSQLRVPAHGRYPKVSLRNAFARSVNPTFGLLGMRMGPEPLHSMAARLGFNRSLVVASGLEPHHSRYVAPDTGFGLAEAASGFTRATTISPLHALQIVRAIGQDGRMLPLRFTDRLESLDGARSLAMAPGDSGSPILSHTALEQLRGLMEATVSSGTARRGFHRNMNAEDVRELLMGGKTGSISGLNPPGRYEWFVGYARKREKPDEGIAIVVMLINKDYLAVHASELAGLVIRDWARYSLPYEAGTGEIVAGK